MCTLQSTKSNISYLMIITIYHKIYIKVCQVFIFVSVINLTQVWCYYYKPVIILNRACFDKVQNPYENLYISLYKLSIGPIPYLTVVKLGTTLQLVTAIPILQHK